MAFNLFFRGELVDGVSADEAAERVSKLVRQSPAEVQQKLFTGNDVKITAAANREKAEKLQQAFERAGVILDIVESKGRRRRKATPSRENATGDSKPSRKWIYAAAAALVVALFGGVAAWYTQPVWRGGIHVGIAGSFVECAGRRWVGRSRSYRR